MFCETTRGGWCRLVRQRLSLRFVLEQAAVTYLIKCEGIGKGERGRGGVPLTGGRGGSGDQEEERGGGEGGNGREREGERGGGRRGKREGKEKKRKKRRKERKRHL